MNEISKTLILFPLSFRYIVHIHGVKQHKRTQIQEEQNIDLEK